MTFEPRISEAAVTVVMIFLNGEKYLDEAIRSVLGQTFAGWKLMLIDDGSIDRSSEIAQQYAAGGAKKSLSGAPWTSESWMERPPEPCHPVWPGKVRRISRLRRCVALRKTCASD